MKYLLAGLIIICPLMTSLADTITIRADEWCPYNCAPKTPTPGYMIEIANIAFEKAGHKVDYKTMPWEKALQSVKEGKINGAIGCTLDDGKGNIFPEVEQGMIRTTFWVKKGHTWKFDGMTSLDKVKIGVITDYGYGDEMNEYLEKNKSDKARIQFAGGDNALDDNIKKLEGGKIDVLLEDANVFQNKINKLAMSEKFVAAGSLKMHPSLQRLYICFAPNNPKSKEYSKILGDGTVALRASGELQKILSKYGLNDWQ